MYYWYKIFTYLFYPFAKIYLQIRKLKKKEHPIRFKEKLSKIDNIRGEGFLIWMHVASVGEAMSILPLIENLIENNKINKILLTSITLSSGKILEKKYSNNSKVVHQFLPLDIPVFTDRFLKHWKPNLAVFVDSEIWPNLILQINKKNIPLVLMNARITKKTFNRWNFLTKFSKNIFGKFDLCIASNKESEEFLKILGAKNVKNYGNLKFSNIKNNLTKNLDSLFLDKIKNKKIWCAASTHQSEEIFCARVHLNIKKNYSNILTIIIPRHVDRVKKIKNDLFNLNLNVIYSSELNKFDNNIDIILIDNYGETSKFYNISNNVFLGKSMVKSLKMDGGQNPIEAARLGCRIFHGPYISNFVEIYKYLKSLGVTKAIHDLNELSVSLVEEFKQDKAINQEVVEKIENYGQNIFNNVIIELKKYIK
jgi:3-deoxy-D-manno-octulosonic-acid transferase